MQELDALFDDELLIQVINKLRTQKGDDGGYQEGKNTLRDVLLRRLPSLVNTDIPAWKRMRRYIGNDKTLAKRVKDYLFTLPHLTLEIFLMLCGELKVKKIESLFFLAAKRNVEDYIVILLRYLSNLGIIYPWYDLFKRLQQENTPESIKHIIHASGQPIEVFLAIFENALHEDKELVRIVFESFPDIDENRLHTITLTSSSQETRNVAAKELRKNDIEFEFDDPFEGTLCEDHIAWLGERKEITPEEEELELLITEQNGPLNAILHTDLYAEEDGICNRYGGCRMYTCTCRENRNGDWFRRKCDNCKGEIASKLEAYRVPCLDGGWLGCYCHPDCFLTRHKKKCTKRWNLIEEILREKTT